MSQIEFDARMEAINRLRVKRDEFANEIAMLHKEAKQFAPQPPNMKNALFPIVRDFNCVVGNNWSSEDIFSIFGKSPFNAVKCPTVFSHTDTIYDILVTAGAFESKGQARKNWQGIKEIPTGYSEIGPIGKGKLMIFVWFPTE